VRRGAPVCRRDFGEELLSGHLDGVLSHGDSLRVERHLRECAICSGIFEELRELREAFRGAVSPRGRELRHHPGRGRHHAAQAVWASGLDDAGRELGRGSVLGVRFGRSMMNGIVAGLLVAGRLARLEDEAAGGSR